MAAVVKDVAKDVAEDAVAASAWSPYPLVRRAYPRIAHSRDPMDRGAGGETLLRVLCRKTCSMRCSLTGTSLPRPRDGLLLPPPAPDKRLPGQSNGEGA